MHTLPEATPCDATLILLGSRSQTATVCPSEVARALARSRDGDDADWRSFMPEVHAAVEAMVKDGRVRLSWKGQACPVRAGPYRLHRGRTFPSAFEGSEPISTRTVTGPAASLSVTRVKARAPHSERLGTNANLGVSPRPALSKGSAGYGNRVP